MAEFDTVSQISKHLSEEFGMDSEDIREMLDILFESIENQIANVQNNLESDNLVSVGNSGHAIKGAAANVGANNISSIGKALEDAGKSADGDKCRELFSQLQNAYDSLKSSS